MLRATPCWALIRLGSGQDSRRSRDRYTNSADGKEHLLLRHPIFVGVSVRIVKPWKTDSFHETHAVGQRFLSCPVTFNVIEPRRLCLDTSGSGGIRRTHHGNAAMSEENSERSATNIVTHNVVKHAVADSSEAWRVSQGMLLPHEVILSHESGEYVLLHFVAQRLSCADRRGGGERRDGMAG